MEEVVRKLRFSAHPSVKQKCSEVTQNPRGSSSWVVQLNGGTTKDIARQAQCDRSVADYHLTKRGIVLGEIIEEARNVRQAQQKREMFAYWKKHPRLSNRAVSEILGIPSHIANEVKRDKEMMRVSVELRQESMKIPDNLRERRIESEIASLQRVSQDRRRQNRHVPLTKDEYMSLKRDTDDSTRQIISMFGSWSKARAAAGLITYEPKQSKNHYEYSAHDVVDYLVEFVLTSDGFGTSRYKQFTDKKALLGVRVPSQSSVIRLTGIRYWPDIVDRAVQASRDVEVRQAFIDDINAHMTGRHALSESEMQAGSIILKGARSQSQLHKAFPGTRADIRDSIAHYIVRGYSLQSCAAELGVHPQTLTGFFRKHDLVWTTVKMQMRNRKPRGVSAKAA